MNEKKFLEFQARMNAMKDVIRIYDPEKFEELSSVDCFWAPETRPFRYSAWVRENYEINPNSIVSLNVYSLLMDMPIDQVREKMIAYTEKNAKIK